MIGRSILMICAMLLMPTYALAAERIVSLKPNITEILFALGAGDRVVGVTTYCDYPDEAKELPRVADYVKPFAERIIDLAPDLIIGSRENSSRKSIEILKRLGYEVKLFSFFTIDETLDSIEGIAKLIGVPERGRVLVAGMERDLDDVRDAGRGKKRPRVLVVWGQRPLIVAGRTSYMQQILDVVGGENVVRGGTVNYPHWSTESVIAHDPDIIIDVSMGSESPDDALWKRLTMVRAVKHGRVYRLDPDMFGRPGPRLVQAARKLAGVIYEDAHAKKMAGD